MALRALLDSGCSKSIILKKFTCNSNRRRLDEKDHIKYETYGGYFTSASVASVAFKLIEFNTYKHKLINYEVQVDETQRSKDSSYDMIIGSDIMSDLDIDLLFSESRIRIGPPSKPEEYDYIPMKELGILSDHKVCSMLYDMHTQAPILQQEEERQSKILDANYTKVDIDAMVEKLDVKRDIKRKLSKTLKQFKTLFGGGFGKVDTKPINLEIKEGTKPYTTTYYNNPKCTKNILERKLIEQQETKKKNKGT